MVNFASLFRNSKICFISVLFILTFISPCNLLSIEPMEFDTILWNHIQKLSLSDYKYYIKKNGGEAEGNKEWKAIIESIWKKMTIASGNPGFDFNITIVKQKNFNAFAFPGGQFIVNLGVLEKFDSIIAEKEHPDSPAKLEKLRESYMASLIAHELSHYYQKHAFSEYKRLLSLDNEKKNIIPQKDVRFEQEQELDADISGVLLMQKSGYNISYFLETLKIINNLHQAELKKGGKYNPYFRSHPSPNERLANMESGEKLLYKRVANLEKAYADIQLGKNLEEARKVIQAVLADYPDNLEFIKADAVALHKIWLATAQVEDLKVKSIIDLPSFRDDMIFEKAGTKTLAKKIPGNRDKYFKVLNAYRKLHKYAPEPYILSNFATLIAYSDVEEDERKAIEIAEKAFRTSKTIQTLNNLAVVHYLCRIGNKNLSNEIFLSLSVILEPELANAAKSLDKKSAGFLLTSELESSWKTQKLTLDDLEDMDFTPVLNLALLDSTNQKNVAKLYFQKNDNTSDWAKYLSNSSGVSLPEPEKKESPIHVEGISVDSTLMAVVEKWGKPDRQSLIENSFDVWNYDDKSIKVYLRNGKVKQILLYDEDSPPISIPISIGFSKKKVEEIMGNDCKRKGNYLIYEKKGKLALTFTKGILSHIRLFE